MILEGSSKPIQIIRRPAMRQALLASAAALALMGASLHAQAMALGAISVRSALGEPLRAEVEVPDLTSEEAATFQAKIGSAQAFRAAGVDYSTSLAGAQVTLQRRPNGQAYLRVVGNRPVNEPFVGIVIEASTAKGNITRDYTMLLDPPGRATMPAVVQARPQVAPQPPAVAQQVSPATAESAPVRRRAPAAAPASSAAGGEVTVHKGDTASRIAQAHAVDGVSLDQMLVALLRANPHAFIRGNVNLMRAGAVLQMPTAEQAQATAPRAARRAVQAQSQDFQTYRHALAQSAQAPKAAAAGGRSASGSVQAEVKDHAAPAPAPDRLTLSKAGAASGTETQVAQTRQQKEQANRLDELKRNESEIARLQAAASAPAGAAASSAMPAINVPVSTPAAAAASAAVTAAASSSPASESAAAAVASDAASAAATATAAAAPSSTPEASAAAANTAPASAAADAASEPAPAPAPAVAKPAPAPAPMAEPSLLDSLTENPLLPAAGIGLLALLAGLGLYRARQRKQKDASLDSEFIESRLQPDSFFGASGGQHVNTQERPSGTGSSSMVYSPSQLDAAGDVDPVAEADVYLAYGRDMQAEEILKEALLTHPGRVSIHRKLAEIYAKRRDARALEAIAAEAHGLTQGSGPDWQAIAALGSELDPTNPMYKPGGAPLASVAPAPGRRQFGADTEPQTAQVILSKDGADTARSALDLNLDLGDSLRAGPSSTSASGKASGVGTLATAAAAAATTAAVAAVASKPTSAPAPLAAPAPAAKPAVPVKADSEFVDLDLGVDFAPPSELPHTPVAAPAPAPVASAKTANSGMIEFDMNALSIDPDSRSGTDIRTEQPDDADEDPLSTKLSLAQEFRAIGDVDGARSLAKEVVAEASGALKIRAERFLTEL